MVEIIEFPNSSTPEQRAECDRVMCGLEQLAEKWAQEVDLPAMARMLAHPLRLSPKAPDDVREQLISRQEKLIARMIEQAWIEGAYHGSSGAFDCVRGGYDPVTRTMKS